MRSIKNIIVIMLLSFSVLIANGKPTDIDKQIMNLSLNYDFDEADKLLSEQVEKGESLKNHFLFLSVEIMKTEDAADKVPFNEKRSTKEKLNEKLMVYAEDVIEKYEDEELSLYEKFYLASIHGILGRLHGVQRSWMSAFSEGKSGRNLMQEIIEEEPDFIDAYLLLGMLNYYADRMGGVTEFVASILGLSGDRNLGIEYLNKVVSSGDLNKWQATMILVEMYSRMEGNKYEALPLLEKLVSRFPNNSKFINWLGYEYINTYQLDKLKNLIISEKGLLLNEFTKAMYYSNVGEYELANKIYDEELRKENTTWPGVYENAKFSRMLNHKLLGNEAISESLAKDLNERYQKYYKLFIDNFFSLKQIEKFKIAVKINDTNFIESFISNPPNLDSSKFVKSQYYFYLGVYSFRINKFNDAEKHFLQARELNSEDYNLRVAQYLIHIYKSITVPVEKVENLLDEIDDYDNDGLEFFAQDLEIKYDL